mgnify:CR=1 FL=1
MEIATHSHASPTRTAEWHRDARSAYQIGIWVNRGERETNVTVAFPNNPIARESLERYVAAMKAVFVGVADGRLPVASRERSAQHEAQRELAPLMPLSKG